MPLNIQNARIVCDRGQLWELTFSKPPTIISSFPCGVIIRLSGQRINQSYVHSRIKTIHMGALETALTSFTRPSLREWAHKEGCVVSFGAFWRKIKPVRLVHTTRRTAERSHCEQIKILREKIESTPRTLGSSLSNLRQVVCTKRLRSSGSRGIRNFAIHTRCVWRHSFLAFPFFGWKRKKRDFCIQDETKHRSAERQKK